MEIKLQEEVCVNPKCNLSFWISQSHQEQLEKQGTTFYCPNGHPQSYNRDEKPKDNGTWSD